MAKTLVLLCMLIGCSQAFPSLAQSAISEDAVSKVAEGAGISQRERQDVILHVIDNTPPVCRVVNESSDCHLSCGNAKWEVTYIMSDGNGSGIDHPIFSATGLEQLNVTFNTGVDENGYNATIVTYSGSCCFTNVEISVVDNAGNIGLCPFNVQLPSTTPKSMTVSTTASTTELPTVSPTSNSPSKAISLWLSLTLMSLTSMLF